MKLLFLSFVKYKKDNFTVLKIDSIRGDIMMYTGRPKIKIDKTQGQKIANIIGYGVFIAAVIFATINVFTLPDEVPIHFNMKGEADGWGSKYFIFILPLIAMIPCGLLEMLERAPEMSNYPNRFNEQNAEAFYRNSIQTLNIIKNAILIIFAIILCEMVFAAQGIQLLPPYALFILTLLLLGIPIIIQLVKQKKIK